MMTTTWWDHIESLEGETLGTLDRNHPFKVLQVTDHAVIIFVLSTGRERRIGKEDFQIAYQKLCHQGEITARQILLEQNCRSSAYVARLLAELPNVRYQLHPIRLSRGNRP